MDHDFRVRAETDNDIAAIRHVNERAFGRADEADLVDALRERGATVSSLVAELSGRVVGHILFSRLPIDRAGSELAGAALAPVAVLPDQQRRGIGSALIRLGLARCRAAGFDAVVVLGHPDYYPRFGFTAGLAERLRAPFSGPAFMALELVPGVLEQGACVRYPAPFFG